MIELYGIPNCDTVKKAQLWLKDNDLAFKFHNYKTEGVSRAKLEQWCKKWGWETVLNKKGTTWKKIGEEEQATIHTTKKAVNFLLHNTSAIKRPILEKDGIMLIGYNENEYRELLV